MRQLQSYQMMKWKKWCWRRDSDNLYSAKNVSLNQQDKIFDKLIWYKNWYKTRRVWFHQRDLFLLFVYKIIIQIHSKRVDEYLFLLSIFLLAA